MLSKPLYCICKGCDYVSIFAERLNKLMAEKGISRIELANAIGVSQPNITYYLKGREPGYDRLASLANYFDVTTDYLTGRVEQKNPKDEIIAQTIESQSESNPQISPRVAEINSYCVFMYNTLSEFHLLEEDGKDVGDIWEMVKLWVNAIFLYENFLSKATQSNYQFDRLYFALENIKKIIDLVETNIDKACSHALKDKNAPLDVLYNVEKKTSFTIKPPSPRRPIVFSTSLDE